MLVRTVTALFLIGGFLAALLWLGGLWFAGLVGLLVAAAAYEWGKLSGFAKTGALAYGGLCLAGHAALVGALHPVSIGHPAALIVFASAVVFWGVAVPALMRKGSGGALPRSAALFPLIGLLVLLPAGLAMSAMPRDLLLAALVLVWISDTAAYLGGRAFGRHKLAPSISPGKTWEGLFCGLVGVLIYAIIYGTLLPGLGAPVVAAAGWAAFLAAAIVLALAGVLGDLFESALKRRAGVKDSGAVLPGHGGVLDRIDSAVAVLPLAAFLLHWIRLG